MKNKLLFSYFLFFLIWVSLQSCNKKKYQKTKDLNFYLVKNNQKYSIYKTIKSTKDSIWYIANDYEVSTTKYLDSINKLENYSDTIRVISKKDLERIIIEKP